MVGACETYKEERNVLQGKIWKIDECDVDNPGTPENGEKTIAILGERHVATDGEIRRE